MNCSKFQQRQQANGFIGNPTKKIRKDKEGLSFYMSLHPRLMLAGHCNICKILNINSIFREFSQKYLVLAQPFSTPPLPHTMSKNEIGCGLGENFIVKETIVTTDSRAAWDTHNSPRPVGYHPQNLLPRLTRRALIWSVPWSCMDVRGSLPRKVNPSFSQLMTGRGSPVALHFSRAVPSTASVWLTGPWRMMGGGLSVRTKQGHTRWHPHLEPAPAAVSPLQTLTGWLKLALQTWFLADPQIRVNN